LYVFFEEYRLFSRALLQKRPIISSMLRTKATPYQDMLVMLRRNSKVYVPLSLLSKMSAELTCVLCKMSVAEKCL